MVIRVSRLPLGRELRRAGKVWKGVEARVAGFRMVDII
jgi:hypothetical protein